MTMQEFVQLVIDLGGSADHVMQALDIFKRASNAKVAQKADRREAPFKPIAQSSARCSVLPLRDWLTPGQVAAQLGISASEVGRLVQRYDLDVVTMRQAPNLVHLRQIAYAQEHHKKLEIDISVFDGWSRQSNVADELDITAREISYWVHDGKIAAYKPHAKIVLINWMDVLDYMDGHDDQA